MIAITGANGLLGSFIVRELVKNKMSFVALKRKNSDTSLLNDIHKDITWLDADILNPVELEEAFQNVDVVIHTAAMVSFNPRMADTIHEVNVNGTRNVVNACLLSNVRKLIHISSVAALGRLKNQRLIDETNKWTDNPLNSTYAKTKYLAELEVFRGKEEGLETVLLNPSVILAPADWNKSSAKLFKYVWDEKIFYINNYLNCVDVRDVATVAVSFVSVPANGERFILNSGGISLLDFLTKISIRFEKRAPRVKLSVTMLKVVAFLEKIRGIFTGSEPLITSETARLAGTEFLYQNQKIKTALNFEFQSIDHTLDWCCRYYINQFRHKK
jgi:dihydroflavonol-4-reductase